MNCRDCGEPIRFLPHSKTGKLTPYDDPLPAPPNHYQSKAHREAVKGSRNGRKPAKIARSAKDSLASPAEKTLRDMNYTKDEAATMLKDIPEGEPDAMVLAALQKMGADA